MDTYPEGARRGPETRHFNETSGAVTVKKPATKTKKSNIEDQHQIALMKWAAITRMPRLPGVEPGAFIADYLIHIPNGGSRHLLEAVKLKAMGAKKGVSDLLLAIPAGGFSGLWIELKAPYTTSAEKNYPTPEQRAWVARMNAAGYRAVVCYGWTEAQNQIARYLNEEQQHDAA